MAYRRKYRKGEVITSLDDLVKQQFVYCYDRIVHGGWVCGWQLSLAKRYVEQGVLFYAVRNDSKEDEK